MAPVPSVGEPHGVVLVALEQRPVVGHAQEVQADVEVLGEQVGQALGGRLVRDAERVAEVLDRELLAPLGRAEVRDRRGARHQAGGGEVGDLDPLAQEVGVAARGRVAEHPVGDRLQRQRAQAVAAGDRRRAAGRCGRWPGR